MPLAPDSLEPSPARRKSALDLSRFPAHALPDLHRALAYLSLSTVMRAILDRIARSDRRVFVEYHPAHTKYLHHNPANLRVQWNPRLGLHDVTGWLSPALLLGHELGHAQLTCADRCVMLAAERPCGFAGERYGTEEAWVIANVERPAVAELNAARIAAGLVPLESADRCQHALGRMTEVPDALSPCPRP